VIALVGAALLLRAGGMDVALADRSYTVDSAPTPYSTSHAIVQSKPGRAEEQPPTF
jgi:hypothetical protein